MKPSVIKAAFLAMVAFFLVAWTKPQLESELYYRYTVNSSYATQTAPNNHYFLGKMEAFSEALYLVAEPAPWEQVVINTKDTCLDRAYVSHVWGVMFFQAGNYSAAYFYYGKSDAFYEVAAIL